MSDAYQEIFSQSETGGILLQREGPEVFIVLDANPASQLAGNWRHLSLEEEMEGLLKKLVSLGAA